MVQKHKYIRMGKYATSITQTEINKYLATEGGTT